MSVINYIKNGVFVRHIYSDILIDEDVTVISWDSGFRVSDSYYHNSLETVHPHSTVVTSECIYCGKKIKSWYPGKIEDTTVLKS